MALDVQKLRRRLPAPPSDGNPALEQTPAMVVAQEPHQPQAPQPARRTARPSVAKVADEARPLDGRSLRATGRTTQLNLKVSDDTKARFLALAAARGVLMAQLFEEAVDLLEKKKAAK